LTTKVGEHKIEQWNREIGPQPGATTIEKDLETRGGGFTTEGMQDPPHFYLILIIFLDNTLS
jgi:hypothetical protein